MPITRLLRIALATLLLGTVTTGSKAQPSTHAIPSPALSLSDTQKLTMRDMTWTEVSAAIASGYKTALVPTGGIEQNGPHMVLSKHDEIVSYAALAIARAIGNTLVAPVISFVPEGDFSPPSDNLRYAGTIGISEAAFEAVLDGVARSLKLAGFTKILFIGDHGQSQASQAKVAARLTRIWRSEGVQVIQIGAYYEDAKQYEYLEKHGETRETIGSHAGLIDTCELLSIAPQAVNLDALKSLTVPLENLGGSGNPERSTPVLGKVLIDMRINAAIAQIRALPQ